MTSGEQSVWAAELVLRRSVGCSWPDSACWAARAVEAMRSVAENSSRLDPPAYRMLVEVISGNEGPT